MGLVLGGGFGYAGGMRLLWFFAFRLLARRRLGLRWLGAWLLLVAVAGGQEMGVFETSSLAWRTALHVDPGAEAPLRSLLELYQKAGRLTELMRLYTDHVAQYPQDEGAAVVLARLLVLTRSPAAGAHLDRALQGAPDSALLAYVRYQWLSLDHGSGALESLAKAVVREQGQPARRELWLTELIQQAAAAGRESLVRECFAALGEKLGTVEARMRSVRRCLEAGLMQAALEAGQGADLAALHGEAAVEARFLWARVLMASGKSAESVGQALALLELLGVEHPRWREAVLLGWQGEAAALRQSRLKAVAQAWQAATGDERQALLYGELLVLAGQSPEALRVWQVCLAQVPESRAVEQRVMQELEVQRQDEALLAFLSQRSRAQPQREDLRVQQVRVLLRLGRVSPGLAALKQLLEGKDPQAKAMAWLQMARWLRQQTLPVEAMALLAAGVEALPGRWDLRKEWAELLWVQGRADEAVRVMEGLELRSMTHEMRLEAVPFLLHHRLLAVARRVLEVGLEQPGTAFDLRLMLARVEGMSGRQGEANQQLVLCRDQCDTEARYVAWLQLAWERAVELEQTSDFLASERQRLWPAEGASWEPLKLTQLAVLAMQVTESRLKEEAERWLREALAQPSLPEGVKLMLRRLLITLLEGQPARSRELEQELQVAIVQSQAVQTELGADDLRLRLLLMYHAVGRLDLVRQTLTQLVIERCQDAGLIQQAIQVLLKLGEGHDMRALAKRLVLLQPKEKAHWLQWTMLLADAGQEAELRQCLREMQMRAGEWQWGTEAQELMMQHLCASAWRSLVPALADPQANLTEAEACLMELELAERPPERRLWLAWARGLLARRQMNEVGLAEARAALQQGGDWIELPDGVSLSKVEALRLLTNAEAPLPAVKPSPVGDYRQPGQLAWAFQPNSGGFLVRWGLSPDGQHVVTQDQYGALAVLERRSGRLRWQTRLAQTPLAAVVSMNGAADLVSEPLEWCPTSEGIVVATDEALTALAWQDGRLLWRVKRMRGPIRMAAGEGQALCWQPGLKRVDAYAMGTGKLLWSTVLADLAQMPPAKANAPQWQALGLQVDRGRVLVSGSGSALLNGQDGAVIWKAGTGQRALHFPLALSAAPEAQMEAAFSLPPQRALTRETSSLISSGFTMASPLSLPILAYPGVFASQSAGDAWLNWGATGSRWLQGHTVWQLSTGLPVVRCSVFGFPQPSRLNPTAAGYSSQAWPLGTVGRQLVLASSNAVVKVSPTGVSVPLLEVASGRNLSPGKHLMPAAALDGSVVVVADLEQAQAVDVLTGTVLWQEPWKAPVAEIMKQGIESLSAWQTMRWSAPGVILYDGQGLSQVLDWRALAREGDIVLPVGLWGLICLRCPPAP